MMEQGVSECVDSQSVPCIVSNELNVRVKQSNRVNTTVQGKPHFHYKLLMRPEAEAPQLLLFPPKPLTHLQINELSLRFDFYNWTLESHFYRHSPKTFITFFSHFSLHKFNGFYCYEEHNVVLQ